MHRADPLCLRTQPQRGAAGQTAVFCASARSVIWRDCVMWDCLWRCSSTAIPFCYRRVRERGQLFHIVSMSMVRNDYTLKVVNKSQHGQILSDLSVSATMREHQSSALTIALRCRRERCCTIPAESTLLARPMRPAASPTSGDAYARPKERAVWKSETRFISPAAVTQAVPADCAAWTGCSMSLRNPISPLLLIILIPLASIIMSAVTVYFALQSSDQVVEIVEEPLSKTSWREEP